MRVIFSQRLSLLLDINMTASQPAAATLGHENAAEYRPVDRPSLARRMSRQIKTVRWHFVGWLWGFWISHLVFSIICRTSKILVPESLSNQETLYPSSRSSLTTSRPSSDLPAPFSA